MMTKRQAQRKAQNFNRKMGSGAYWMELPNCKGHWVMRVRGEYIPSTPLIIQ